MKFSERMGFKKPKSVIQIKSMDSDLRNGIWNCLNMHLFDHFGDNSMFESYTFMQNFIMNLWTAFFKLPLDERPRYKNDLVDYLRSWFFSKSSWYDIYDFVEFVITCYTNEVLAKRFVTDINFILARELSGYRVVSSVVTPITSETDINEIQKASAGPFRDVNTHINQAIRLMSDKKNPDYRNSIKESISALEALCKLISKNEKSTLGDALAEIQRTGKIELHEALKRAFSALYGYTNDADGIRHALMDKEVLDIEDALFMLVSCSAFINFLLTKSEKAGIRFS